MISHWSTVICIEEVREKRLREESSSFQQSLLGVSDLLLEPALIPGTSGNIQIIAPDTFPSALPGRHLTPHFKAEATRVLSESLLVLELDQSTPGLASNS